MLRLRTSHLGHPTVVAGVLIARVGDTVLSAGVLPAVAVVVELSLMPADDLRSARAARVRRTSYSQLVHGCS